MKKNQVFFWIYIFFTPSSSDPSSDSKFKKTLILASDADSVNSVTFQKSTVLKNLLCTLKFSLKWKWGMTDESAESCYSSFYNPLRFFLKLKYVYTWYFNGQIMCKCFESILRPNSPAVVVLYVYYNFTKFHYILKKKIQQVLD